MQKIRESAGSLSKQMQQGKFEKRYLAYVEGYPEDEEGGLIDELEKDTKNNCSRVVERKRLEASRQNYFIKKSKKRKRNTFGD